MITWEKVSEFTRSSKDPWATRPIPTDVASRLPPKLVRSGFDGVAYWGLVSGKPKKKSDAPPVRLHWVIGDVIGESVDEFPYQYNPTFDRARKCVWLVTHPNRVVRISLEDGRHAAIAVEGIDVPPEREPLFAEPWLLTDGRLLLDVALDKPYGSRKFVLRPVDDSLRVEYAFNLRDKSAVQDGRAVVAADERLVVIGLGPREPRLLAASADIREGGPHVVGGQVRLYATGGSSGSFELRGIEEAWQACFNDRTLEAPVWEEK